MLKKFVKVKDKNKDQTNETTKQQSNFFFQKIYRSNVNKIVVKIKNGPKSN